MIAPRNGEGTCLQFPHLPNNASNFGRRVFSVLYRTDRPEYLLRERGTNKGGGVADAVLCPDFVDTLGRRVHPSGGLGIEGDEARLDGFEDFLFGVELGKRGSICSKD